LARTKDSAARLSKLFQDPDAMVKRYIALLVPPKPEYAPNKKFTITSGIVKYVKDEKEKMRAVEWSNYRINVR
jgi:23S rRNA-/tRNA-specific pseudouridylate synthase